jgi:hypothetical protein
MKHCSPKHKVIVRADIGPTMPGRMEHCTRKYWINVRADIGPTLTLRWGKTQHEC